MVGQPVFHVKRLSERAVLDKWETPASRFQKQYLLYAAPHKETVFVTRSDGAFVYPCFRDSRAERQSGSSGVLFWGIVFILSITLTKSLYPKYYWGFNGVSWFLSSYAVICLLTPVLLHKTARLLENKKFKTVAKTIFVIVILQFCYCFLIGRTDWNIEYWIYIFPLSRLGEYVTAMIVGMYAPRLMTISETEKTDTKAAGQCQEVRIKSLFLNLPGILGWIAVIGIALLIIYVPMPEWMLRSVVWIVPNMALLWGIYRSKGFLARFLSLRPLVVLGNYSAYMFLVHPVIYGYFGYFGLTGNTPGTRILVMVLNYMITFALSAGFGRLTEKSS